MSAAAFWGIGTAFTKSVTVGELRSPGIEIITTRQATGSVVAKVAAHAGAGGVLAELQGGNFGNGFLAAGVTQALNPAVGQIEGGDFSAVTARTLVSATIGGTVSKITGGSFANGAATGAFSYLFSSVVNQRSLQGRVEGDGLEHAESAAESASFAESNNVDFDRAMNTIGNEFPELAPFLYRSGTSINTGGDALGQWTSQGIALDVSVTSGAVRLPFQHALVLAAHEALHPLVFQYEGGQFSYTWREFWSPESPTTGYGYPHYWVDRRGMEIGNWINQGPRYQSFKPRPDISRSNYTRCVAIKHC